MNQADHFDMDREDALRELGFRRQALRAVAARALLHNVPGDPDRLDECEDCECPAVEYVPNGSLDWGDE
jgi:hypothetical protein